MTAIGVGERATGQSAGQLLRAYRFPLIVVGVVLVGAVILALLGSSQRSGALDPSATDPAGSKAIAVLLDERGSDVHRVLGTAEAARALPASGGTLLVTDRGTLPAPTLRTLAGLGPAVRVVLLAPDPSTLDALDAGMSVDPVAPLLVQTRAAGCALPAARTAGSVRLGGEQLSGGELRCYDRTLATGHTATGAELVVLGSPDLLTNDGLGKEGDAALALGVLGQRGPVLWSLPGSSDVVGGAGSRSVTDVLPGWVVPICWMLLLVGLLVGLWRGRRFGRLVAEPLPVLVRAAEVVEGRGRLYRRGRARDSAAEALRVAARHQLLPALGLGLTADAGDDERSPAAICQAVAVRTARPVAEVGALLYGGTPADDADLVALAGRLDRLVRQTTTDPRTTVPSTVLRGSS